MDRTPEPNRIAARSSTVSSSPSVQESPFSNFVSNLSPIDTMKAVSCTQALFGTNLPASPVVFTSPHINLQRQTSFLERDDKVEAGLDVYKECNTTLVQNPRFEDVQLCSPSGCVDDFLADPVEAGCANFADLHLQPTDEVPQLSHSGLISRKESEMEVHDVTSFSTANKALMLSGQAEHDRPLSSLEKSEAAINQRGGKAKEELSRFTFEKVKESGRNADLFSGAQNCGETAAKLQSAGCLYDEQNSSGQSYEYSKTRRTKVLKGLVKEGAQNQYGIRRHLQFEAGKAYKLTIPTNLKNPASSHFHNRASSCPRAISPDPSQLPSCPYESVTSAQIDVNSAAAAAAPIHSGIGLHLNHIATSTSMTSDIFPSKKPTGYLTTPEQHINSDKIAMNSSSTLTSPVCGIFYSHVASGQHESQAVTEPSSFNFHSTETMMPLCDSRHLMPVDQEADPCDAGMSPSQDTDSVHELNQLGHKGKRKKEANTSEACKRCNCRRSKCLKLYCECFAAGIYCLDSCACQNCYNKPEFEDTVFEIRQLIESRNPLAFTPKVVDNAIDSSANSTEDQNLTTPASARHKKGCNCKKSKCLKKYCECYQAKVGCSGGCRCEDCQNTFGRMAESVYNGAKRWEAHPTAQLAASINKNSPTFEVLSDISNLTPLTNPTSRPAISSASSSRRNAGKIPQAQLSPSQHLSDTGRLNWGCSHAIVAQPLPEGNVPCVLSSAGACHDMMDDDTPEILEETSNPSKAVMVSSPNKKRVSPPQSRSRLRSGSPRGLRSGRKFILHAVPSFPPLTPYRSSKEGASEIGNDDEATNKNSWTTHKELDEA